MSASPNPYARRPAASHRGPDGLADVLERILDKGLVVAGDIQINLLDIELITIKVRLLLASADTAQQMGIDWWKHDPFLASKDRELAQENEVLRDRVDQLELAMGRKLVAGEPSPGDVWGESAQDRTPTRGQRLPTGVMRSSGRGGDGRSEGHEGGASREASDEPRHEPARPEEVEVDELILEHDSGGPELRMTAVDEDEVTGDEQVIEGVEELIIEHGDGGPELRVTAEDLEHLADSRGEAGDEAATEEDEGDWLDEESIASMTRVELQGELAARDLPTSGNKDVLRARLLEALEDEWETVPAGASGEGTGADDDGT